MALILQIDTATDNAGVCLSREGVPLASLANADQKSHASFVQPAIQQVMAAANYPLTAVDAIAVTSGPGSYTGLRVGLSSAKGLCFALNKPLIMVNTLEVIAAAQLAVSLPSDKALICPMIDARRMEVFTALYDCNLQAVLPPAALILDENSFAAELANQPIVFCGNGSSKWQPLITNTNAVFSNTLPGAETLAVLAWNAFKQGDFADLAYSEPFYLKEFFTPIKATLKGV